MKTKKFYEKDIRNATNSGQLQITNELLLDIRDLLIALLE